MAPGHDSAWYKGATCLHTGSAAYTKLKKHVLAAEDARSALKGAPKGSVKAHYRLASALLAQGKYQVRLACPLIRVRHTRKLTPPTAMRVAAGH